MAITPSRLYFGQPSTGDTTLFTASTTYVILKEVVVTNTTATAATFNLALNGTSATASNCFLGYQYSVGANSTVVFALSTVLANTNTIHGLQATSGALSVTISGVLGP